MVNIDAKTSTAIANAYVRRITRGRITIDNVPDQIRAEVEAILNQTTEEDG